MFSVGSCQLVLAHDSNDGQLACGGLSKHDDFLNSLGFCKFGDVAACAPLPFHSWLA